MHAITSVGDALNRRPAATALVSTLQTRVDMVRRRTQGLSRPTVLMPLWYDPITTIGAHAFITEVIAAAGGRSNHRIFDIHAAMIVGCRISDGGQL